MPAAGEAVSPICIPPRNVRSPDAGVQCGPIDEDGTHSTHPRVVFEVLSDSTRYFDLLRQLDDYKTIPGLAHIILVNPDAAEVIHWTRPAGDAWQRADLFGRDAVLHLDDPALTLPLADLYDGLTPRPRPHLVPDDEPAGGGGRV